MQIADKKVVSIHYTLTNGSKEVLDSSEGRSPLSYIHGVGNIIPGLEKALDGKAEGEKVTVDVPPEEGYGSHKQALVMEVPREKFQGVEKIEPGMQFEAQGPQGNSLFKVLEVNDQAVKVDGNHPLAGEELHFDVEIVGVRDATAEELSRGSVGS